MVQYNPLQYLPSSAELPNADDTPVDNELQNLIPNLLLAILAWAWRDRADWFFGIDMGVYHTAGQNPRTPVVPDGFLSLGVERRKGEKGRLSYVLWEEDYIVPCLALEVVSQTYGGEYDKKKAIYATLGVLYYVVYNPDYAARDKQEPLEVYRLVEGEYIRQLDEPVWMPEIGLGIGRGQGSHEGWEREWLYWYDQAGNRLPTPEERANQAEQELESLVAKLREKGINPEML
jgi:Uma2 family endonuclease